MKIIAPSILSADFGNLSREISRAEKGGADWIHVDVMDGRFVPNITIGPAVVKAAARATSLPLDVHLMIQEPQLYIKDFAKAGAAFISIHAEACVHLDRTLNLIKECGARPGVALNPSTSLSTVEWILEDLDFIVLMSVNPGFGGQDFIPSSLQKTRKLKELISKRGLNIMIEMDGGINNNTIKAASDAGVDVFVAGSAIFKTDDYKKTISRFKEIIE